MKVLYFLLASCLLFSCSGSDNEFMESPTGIQSFQRLTPTQQSSYVTQYANIVTTSQYTSFSSALNAFVTKLNGYSGNFNSKSAWMSYISSNFSHMSFSSMTEANNLYDTVASRFSTLYNANTSFYNGLVNADDENLKANLLLNFPYLIHQQTLHKAARTLITRWMHAGQMLMMCM